jgi:uncharacterized protein with NRDE domain
VCLLIVMFGVLPDAPLIVAANRDERYERPAVAMTVLRDRDPRILGGRDLQAGGTWLAVSERGVLAGLTNTPSAGGRDPAKRSRGELPLAFAGYTDAEQAVAHVTAELDPASYNPCWLLVGDRQALYFIAIGDGPGPKVQRLEPGMHILENAPLQPMSAKARHVAALVADARARQGHGHETAASLAGALAAVLPDHGPAPPIAGDPPVLYAGREMPPELSAACVHTPTYGTRSAAIVTVPARGLPRILAADGPPCTTVLQDHSALWTGNQAGSSPGQLRALD